jgi:hypothetical protein
MPNADGNPARNAAGEVIELNAPEIRRQGRKRAQPVALETVTKLAEQRRSDKP